MADEKSVEGRGRKKRSRRTSGQCWRTSGGCWRIRKERPADGKDGEVVGKRPLDKGGKEGGRERSGEVQREGGYHGKELGASGRREFAVERLLGKEAGERVLPALQWEGVLRWGYGC